MKFRIKILTPRTQMDTGENNLLNPCYLFRIGKKGVLDVGENLRYWTTSLFSSSKSCYAISALVVTTVLNFQEGTCAKSSA
jgi:hypothetical protein